MPYDPAGLQWAFWFQAIWCRSFTAKQMASQPQGWPLACLDWLWCSDWLFQSLDTVVPNTTIVLPLASLHLGHFFRPLGFVISGITFLNFWILLVFEHFFNDYMEVSLGKSEKTPFLFPPVFSQGMVQLSNRLPPSSTADSLHPWITCHGISGRALQTRRGASGCRPSTCLQWNWMELLPYTYLKYIKCRDCRDSDRFATDITLKRFIIIDHIIFQ